MTKRRLPLSTLIELYVSVMLSTVAGHLVQSYLPEGSAAVDNSSESPNPLDSQQSSAYSHVVAQCQR